MNWVRIVVVAVSSGLAGGLVELLFRGKARGGAYWATMLLAIGVANTLTQSVILPQINSRYAMQSIPALVALEKLDPAAADQIRSLLRDGSRRRGAGTENSAKIRDTLAAAMMKHASKASDEAVITLIEVALDSAGRLKDNPQMCHQYFYPDPGRFIDYTKIFDQPPLDREQKAMENVFRTAAENPERPVPTEADVSAKFTAVVASLAKRGFKEDAFQAMENPSAPGVDSGQLYAVTIAMYQEILAMPAKDRGRLLRYLFALS